MPPSNRIPQIIAELPVAVRAALVASAQKIAQDAKDRCPYDDDNPPHLRDAIHVEIEQGPDELAVLSGRKYRDAGVYVIAGDEKVYWGHMVEHGTTHSAPHPFLVPALEENRDSTVAAIEQAIRQAAR